MRIRWSPEAADDLARIIEYIEYIRNYNPAAARRAGRSIYETIDSLRRFPSKGRPGEVPGTRELVFSVPFRTWPFIGSDTNTSK